MAICLPGWGSSLLIFFSSLRKCGKMIPASVILLVDFYETFKVRSLPYLTSELSNGTHFSSYLYTWLYIWAFFGMILGSALEVARNIIFYGNYCTRFWLLNIGDFPIFPRQIPVCGVLAVTWVRVGEDIVHSIWDCPNSQDVWLWVKHVLILAHPFPEQFHIPYTMSSILRWLLPGAFRRILVIIPWLLKLKVLGGLHYPQDIV